jgi:hypothetical protein
MFNESSAGRHGKTNCLFGFYLDSEAKLKTRRGYYVEHRFAAER